VNLSITLHWLFNNWFFSPQWLGQKYTAGFRDKKNLYAGIDEALILADEVLHPEMK
jgi:hypothetical protein